MYYEMRTYTVQIGKMNEYLRHFEKEGLPVISRYATLVGWWYTEIGELNQVVHIWAYESLDDRIKRRTALYEDPDWLEIRAEGVPDAREDGIETAAPGRVLADQVSR